MSWLSEELSGWQIGSGYYSTNVGTDEAKDMARTIEEALRSDDVIERAAKAFYEEPGKRLDPNLRPRWERLAEDPYLADQYRSAIRAALTAALGIEGEQ